MKSWSAALLAVVSLAALASSSVTQTRPIDSTRSQAQFSVRELLIAHANGTFPRVVGTLRRIGTPGGPDLVEVDANLDITALQMDDPSELEHALGPRFFDADRYPHARFVSDPFPLGELASGGTVHGLLTLHGRRQPVTLTLEPSDCPRQPLECVIRVHGAISRSRFGMHAWRGVLGDEVKLDLRILLSDRP